MWVTATRTAIDEAVKRNAFARSLKREVKAPPDLGVQLDRQLENAALDALGIAHKAGRVAIGFGRTETALAAVPPVAAILSASDGLPTGPARSPRPPPSAKWVKMHPKSRSLRRLLRRNWIWHWGGQMWYMLPCSPAQRATGS